LARRPGPAEHELAAVRGPRRGPRPARHDDGEVAGAVPAGAAARRVRPESSGRTGPPRMPPAAAPAGSHRRPTAVRPATRPVDRPPPESWPPPAAIRVQRRRGRPGGRCRDGSAGDERVLVHVTPRPRTNGCGRRPGRPPGALVRDVVCRRPPTRARAQNHPSYRHSQAAPGPFRSFRIWNAGVAKIYKPGI